MRVVYSILAVLPLNSLAQQLVLNSSFEDYTDCPWTFNQIQLAQFWSRPTEGSPEYNNACSVFPYADAPQNYWGYQPAHTGVAYASFGCYIYYTPNFREYIQGTLAQPLVAGQCYHMEAFLSMSECNYATTHFGIWFTDTALTGINDYLPLSVNPQVLYTGPPLTDTVNWTLMSGDFVAEGGEVAFIFGLFEDDIAATFEEAYDTQQLQSCYYIDDITVVAAGNASEPCDPATAISQNAKGAYAVSYDPTAQVLLLTALSSEPTTLDIFDVSGRWVGSSKLTGTTTQSIAHLPDGIYICSMRNEYGAIHADRIIKH
jgi:hypothetical protein